MVRGRFARSRPLDGRLVVGIYSGLIAVGELAGVLGVGIAGAILDAALVTALLCHYVWGERTAHRNLLPVLALVALLRVLSITAAIPRLPTVTWYITVGGALLIGEILTMRLVSETSQGLNWAIRRRGLDLGLVAAGIPAGLIGYWLLRPLPLMPDATMLQAFTGMIGVVVFGGFVEALLFRGILQSVAIESFGSEWTGLLYAASMATVMYLGSGSLLFTLAMGLYGLALGAAILRGGSLWGTAASHGLALVGMGFVWPVLIGHP